MPRYLCPPVYPSSRVISLKGYGGAGIYSINDTNPYWFAYLRDCFRTEEEAKQCLIKQIKKEIKRIENSKAIDRK